MARGGVLTIDWFEGGWTLSQLAVEGETLGPKLIANVVTRRVVEWKKW